MPDNALVKYDGSFPGLFTAIFEIYRQKLTPFAISATARVEEMLFAQEIVIETNDVKSERVLKALQQKTSERAIRKLYKTFLSEAEDREQLIYEYVRYAMKSPVNIEEDMRKDFVLRIHKLAGRVSAEVHRMHAFVRFQKLSDGMYAATINPDHDVIPLIGDHFEKRYADQEWLIYDTKRNSGLHYDLRTTEFVTLSDALLDARKQIPTSVLSEDELFFQKMWKHYFESVNIPERKNIKLHLQHVPRRYWKYLPEKSPTK